MDNQTPITVTDLPEPEPSRTMRYRGQTVTVEGRRAHLACPSCMERYSAHPGDYFWMPPNEPFTCGACGELLELRK